MASLKPRSAIVVSLLGVLVSTACAPAPSAPAAPPARSETPTVVQSDPLQPLIEAARKDGELTLVWGESTAGGGEGARRFVEGLNRRYGLNLHVQFTPGPSMPEVAARIAQEYQANRRASSDVFIGPEFSILSLMQVDALERVDWTSWAPNVRNPALVAPGGVAVEIMSSPPGITYNASKLSGDAVPTSLQDLLKPQYKGRIASTPYAAMFEHLTRPEMWGEQRTKEYLAKLADQVAGLIRCGEGERIVSGEFDMLAMDCGSYEAHKRQARGQPIDHVVPSDAALIFHWYMGVPRNAAHPNAAKLFIDYVLSREGQDILFDVEATDHHLVEGSKAGREIQQLQARGVKFTELNVESAQRYDAKEIDRVRAELQAILRKQ